MKEVVIMAVVSGRMSMPAIIVAVDTNFAHRLFGIMSPYPTPVSVTMDHHIDAGMELKGWSGSSHSHKYMSVADRTTPVIVKNKDSQAHQRLLNAVQDRADHI